MITYRTANEKAVLHFFASRERAYGREIRDALDLSDGASIYGLLKRLRLRGYIRFVGESFSESGPPRRYYEITARGRSRLVEYERNPTGRRQRLVV